MQTENRKRKAQAAPQKTISSGKKTTRPGRSFCALGLFAMLLFCVPAYAATERAAESVRAAEAKSETTAEETGIAPQTENVSEAAETQSGGTGTASGTAEEQVVISEMEEQREGISLALSYGYQNTARAGRYVPFQITIGNHNGEGISGSLELSVSGGETVRYRSQVEIPAGQTLKLRESAAVSLSSDSASARLYNADGTLLAETETALSVQEATGELLIGILSDTPQALSYFRGVSIGNTELRTRTVVLDASELPETEEGLSQLDALIISHFDYGKLSDETIRAFLRFAEDGGTLLLGTGRNGLPEAFRAALPQEIEISDAREQTVNMGLQYSSDTPDSAQLSLAVRDIYAENGVEVLQSDSLAVLTELAYGNGVIGLCAFDLCDIREFSARQTAYPDAFLQALFGNRRLKELSRRSADAQTDAAELTALVDVPDPAREPNLSVYLVIAAVYVLMAGPGLYFLLKQQGLELYYAFSVLILSGAAALVIWLCGLPTRFEHTVLQYAVVREYSGGQRNETEVLGISAPAGMQFRVSVQPGYQVQPVLSAEKAEKHQTETLLSRAAEGGSVACTGTAPFEQKVFRVYGSGETAETPELTAELSCFLDTVSGSITNHTEQRFSDVAILLYGRLVPVGTLLPGETKELSGIAPVYTPLGAAALTAARVTGMPEETEGSAALDTGALLRTRLLSRYIGENLSHYYGGARILAFPEDAEAFLCGVEKSGTERYGTALFSAEAEVSFRRGNEVFRSALSAEPKVVSGSYDAANNAMDTGAPLVLEYALGSDLRVSSLHFYALSEEFSGKETDGKRIYPFRGERALYNYRTGVYDLPQASDGSLSGTELSPYLSPSNTIMVRYLPDESFSGEGLFVLPVPAVTGTEES